MMTDLTPDERALEKLRAAHAAVDAAVLERTATIAAARLLDPPLLWREIATMLGKREPHTIRKYRPLLTDLPVHSRALKILDEYRGGDARAWLSAKLKAADRAVPKAERAELAAVAAARNADVSWIRIAEAVGRGSTAQRGNVAETYRSLLKERVQKKVTVVPGAKPSGVRRQRRAG